MLKFLKIDEGVIDSLEQIKKYIVIYFKKLFEDDIQCRLILGSMGMNKLIDIEGEDLVKFFSMEEIKVVVQLCSSSKVQGLDGFNFGFIKNVWDIIKEDVFDMMGKFWENGDFFRDVNIILKIKGVIELKDFRLISMVGIIYKIIVKVLFKRLKGVMGNLVGEI